MTKTSTHTAACLLNAQIVVQEELELQGLDWTPDADEVADCSIPAWGMTIGAVRDSWLEDGTTACRCAQ